MIPKISLTPAFLLMVAPPMACASNRAAANPAPITREAHQSPPAMVVVQYNQSNAGTSDNDNDSDSNDSADDNQNADGNQMDQQNATGDDQPIPPQIPNAPDDPSDDQQAPPMNAYPQAGNPYQ